MKLPTDPSKYLYSWRLVEIAKYVPSLDRVIRQKNGEKPILIDVDQIERFRQENNNLGLYTSIWRYNMDDVDNAVRLGPLYFDLDNEDVNIAHFECLRLYFYLTKYIPEESVHVFYTGKKGFHIECEPITLGINPSNNLPNIFRYIANTLKIKLKIDSLDMAVYDARRMWRLEGSKHQSTGLHKNRLPIEIFKTDPETIQEYCEISRTSLAADPVFDATANEWFREFSYEQEIDKERSKDFLAYFNKHGSSAFKDYEESDKEFTRDRLLEGCSAIKDLWTEAVDKKWLDHEARLFLCSILSYTDDSIQFLHEILSNCDDYNVEKTNSHVNAFTNTPSDL